MNVFNPAQFRAQFPALQDAGVYLDSAATALKPEAVVEATRQFYSLSAGNVHRSQFAEAQRLTARYEAAREKVAQLLNAPDDKTIVWTRGTTESINMVAQCYARPRLQPGDEIIVSVAEHHANLVPWLMVAQQTGAKVVKLPLNAQRLPDVDLLPELITPRSRILALGQMSNVTGGCPDLARAITFAHSAGMVVMVDGAQGAVHFPADVQQLDIDFYAFSGHKLYGPTGIGVLYGKRDLLDRMPPFLSGGDMVDRVSFEKTTFAPVPLKFEAGTANFVGAIALGEAVRYVRQFDAAEVEAHERALLRRATEGLERIPGLRIYGTTPDKCAIVSFNVEGVHPYDMGMILDKLGIAVRTGQHCAEPVMTHYGVTGMCRASFAMYNTLAEADALVAGVERAVKMLK